MFNISATTRELLVYVYTAAWTLLAAVWAFDIMGPEIGDWCVLFFAMTWTVGFRTIRAWGDKPYASL